MSAQFAKDPVSYFAPVNISEASPSVFAPSNTGIVGKGLRAVARSFSAMMQRRAVIGELSALSDHELADIGLSRVDIPRVFDRAFVAARSMPNAARF
jgi:uncharacterized protein YjiS (DUF1127 family)